MKDKFLKTFIICFVIFITSCATQRLSTIVGGEYNESKNETDYFVFPFGAVTIPGKWEKKEYNPVSKQQYFTNQDSVILAIAFGRYNNYEFNLDGSYKEFDFVMAYYEWDSEYFIKTYGLKRELFESDSIKNFLTYRIYGDIEQGKFNTYFLVGENRGNISLLSISKSEKWTSEEKFNFLKKLYLKEKN